MDIRLIVFDFDGVFADSLDLYIEAYIAALRSEKIEATYDDLRPFLGKGIKETIGALIGEEVPDPEALVRRVKDNIHQFVLTPAAVERYKLIDGSVEALSLLDSAFPVPRIILSHSEVRFVSGVLRSAGVDSMFTKILGGDSGYSSKAEALIALAEEFGIEPKQIAFVGDTTYDMMAGLDAGVTRIGVVGWHTREQLESTQPDYVISSLLELLDIIKK